MTTAIDVRVLRSREEIEAMQADWQRLNSLPENDWEMYWGSLESLKPRPEPYVVIALEGGGLRSALVGRLEVGHVSLGLGYWTLLRIPVQQIVIPMQGVLGQDDERTLATMIDRVAKDVRGHLADVAVFEFLEEGSALHRTAKGLPVGFWMRDRVLERRVHRYVNLPATFKEYDRQHKGLLQKVRKFERAYHGRFEHRLLTREDEIEFFCQGADAVARRNYQRALGVGFLDSEQDRAKMRVAARQGLWRAFVTLVDGKTAAFWSGCQFGSHALLWWTGYDPDFQQFSPGLIASARMVEEFIGQGVTRVDFGGGDAPYKERLANESRWEETVCVYSPGFKGALASGVRGLDAYVGNMTRTRFKGLANRLKTPWRRFMARRMAARQAPPAGGGGDTGTSPEQPGGTR
jgi:hypothetical protein